MKQSEYYWFIKFGLFKRHQNSKKCYGIYSIFNRAPVAAKSKMQEAVMLSVTGAELMAANYCYQEMLYDT
jgi:hypothetical protein